MQRVVKQFSTEQRAVAEALFGLLRPGVVFVHADILPSVVERAEHHGVLAVLAGDLDTDRLEAGQRRVVETARLQAVAAHLSLVSQLPRIADALDAGGLRWAAFKGPVLAVEAYGDPSHRRYADLDLLVAARQFGAAVDALCASGGLLIDKNWSYQLTARRAEASILFPGGPHVDLHWHLCNERAVRATTSIDIDAALERRRSITLHGDVTIPALDAVDTLLATLLHAAMNGASRLLWLKDIERLVSAKQVDWAELAARARAARIGVPLQLVLRRCQRLLAAPVPDAAVSGLGRGHPWAGLLDLQQRRVDPAGIVWGRSSGRAAITAARDGLVATAVATADELARRRARSAGVNGSDQNPLAADDDDPGAKEAYLAAICGDAA